jgi:DNA-binding NtrC family response regulator/nitrogen-specific signal transduction histidine kinase
MEPIRVLYVDDSPADQELTARHLARHAPRIRLQVASTVSAALAELARGETDLVLSDFRLPDGNGLDLLERVTARQIPVPVVLVTGSGDVDTAVRLLKAGAADYVVKRSGYLDTLPPVIEAAWRWFQSLRELRRSVVRVLYAEHDEADVELTLRAFRQHGAHLELDVARLGREALERLRTSVYDLFLLDYRMPDLSGIEILKTLRDERINVPAVIVTGQGDEETAVQAFKLGAADYIIKGQTALTALPVTIENVLAQRRLAEEKDALLVLNGLTRSIATLPDLDAVVQAVVASARDLLGGDASVLWLLQEGTLVPASWRGLDGDTAAALRVAARDTGVLEAASERRLATSRLVGGPGVPPAAASLADPSRTLAVSLAVAGRVTGALAVGSARPRLFSGSEERLLTILADHAAIAINNLNLREELHGRLEELHRTQARLIQTEKIAAMGQLLAGVAHELNNPLAVVLGRAALLSSRLTGTGLEGQTAKIAEAAERCARIVRNFLALARQRPPERQAVRLPQIVQEAVELLAYQLHVADIRVRVEAGPDVPVLWADPHQLLQVIVNLLSNAHHVLRSAPPPRQIALTTAWDAARRVAILRVEDTGPGVPPEIQDRIFEPFFTTKPPGEGTGLGLPLCQSIVESHGGTIRLDSPAGRGALFTVELPVQAPPPVEVAATAAGPDAAAGPKRILVVDDEQGVASTLADMLTSDGHQVDVAQNGRTALDRIRASAYDLVVSDLRMPELDGPGLYRELERLRPDLLRRILFLTGDTLDPGVATFLEQTGVPSVSKPFTWEEMRRALHRALMAGS